MTDTFSGHGISGLPSFLNWEKVTEFRLHLLRAFLDLGPPPWDLKLIPSGQMNRRAWLDLSISISCSLAKKYLKKNLNKEKFSLYVLGQPSNSINQVQDYIGGEQIWFGCNKINRRQMANVSPPFAFVGNVTGVSNCNFCPITWLETDLAHWCNTHREHPEVTVLSFFKELNSQADGRDMGWPIEQKMRMGDSINDGVKSVWAGRVEKMAGRMVSSNYIIRD